MDQCFVRSKASLTLTPGILTFCAQTAKGMLDLERLHRWQTATRLSRVLVEPSPARGTIWSISLLAYVIGEPQYAH